MFQNPLSFSDYVNRVRSLLHFSVPLNLDYATISQIPLFLNASVGVDIPVNVTATPITISSINIPTVYVGGPLAEHRPVLVVTADPADPQVQQEPAVQRSAQPVMQRAEGLPRGSAAARHQSRSYHCRPHRDRLPRGGNVLSASHRRARQGRHGAPE